MHSEVWTYPDPSRLGATLADVDITGYDVEALDGSIGKVDEATYETETSYVIVDTGPWIFGKKVMLPAGVISSIDENEEVVYVNRAKDEIKNAPEFDDAMLENASYYKRLGDYYAPGESAERI